jgi:predicted ribosomally synthesized peptide with nif11-like leader
MKNLTPEIIAKAKAAASAEELFAIAKENNVEITEEEAKKYFAQLAASDKLSDDELDLVAGGCGDDGDEKEENGRATMTANCPFCTRPVSRVANSCPWCGKMLIIY